MLERRIELEAKMTDLVSKMHAAMREVEDMMLAGYRGREAEADRAINMGPETSKRG